MLLELVAALTLFLANRRIASLEDDPSSPFGLRHSAEIDRLIKLCDTLEEFRGRGSR